MGWKTSLLIIENKKNSIDDLAILKAIGKSNYIFDKELTLDECIYPNDNSINIGYYNGNIIISDDYQITSDALETAGSLQLTREERGLVTIFPNSEIVMVACHSVVNYHGYSLIQNGIKKRLKVISSDTPLIEFGERMEEELEIYKRSYLKDNQSYWKNDDDSENDYIESQLMEEFTFGVAKRRLGVSLDYGDGEELMEKVVFKKYISSSELPDKETSKKHQRKITWIKYGLIILIIIILQLLRRVLFD